MQESKRLLEQLSMGTHPTSVLIAENNRQLYEALKHELNTYKDLGVSHHTFPIKADTLNPVDLCIALITSRPTSSATYYTSLGLIKNLYCKHIECFLPPEENSLEILSMLVSLGFLEKERLKINDHEFRRYSYHLNSYNRKRSWNNSKYWANPENFNKFRW